MTPFRYQINLQWSDKRNAYEAYAPTLLADVNRFIPEFILLAYDTDPTVALSFAMKKAQEAVAHLKKMNILPPEDARTVRFEKGELAYG